MLKHLTVRYYLGWKLACLSIMALVYGFAAYRTGEVIFIEWEIVGTNRASIIMTLLID